MKTKQPRFDLMAQAIRALLWEADHKAYFDLVRRDR